MSNVQKNTVNEISIENKRNILVLIFQLVLKMTKSSSKSQVINIQCRQPISQTTLMILIETFFGVLFQCTHSLFYFCLSVFNSLLLSAGVRAGEVVESNPEAEFLDEIQTKVLRVFLVAIYNHLYSFLLRFIFLQTHATSYNLYSSLYTVKEKGA